MRDPELVSLAQRAAARLELAWERWRVRHGLGGAVAQLVAGYVGYSSEQPSGRPRVVFGVDAAEAEQLAVLLDGDTSTARGIAAGTGLVGERDRDPGTNPGAIRCDHAADASPGATPVVAPGATARATRVPGTAPAKAAVDGRGGGSAVFIGEGPAGPAPDPPRSAACPGMPAPSMAAELAGWATSELPGQASARLAAWIAAEQESRTEAGCPKPRDPADIEREGQTGSLSWPV